MRLTRSANVPALISLLLSLFILAAPLARAQRKGAPPPVGPRPGGRVLPPPPPDPLPTMTFSNTGAITITSDSSNNVAASPYPSVINVSGLAGTITSLTVTLTNINHTDPTDIDILLQSPAGNFYTLLSDTGSGTDAVNVTITLSDAAASSVPHNGNALVSGTFKPTDFDATSGTTEDVPWPAPVPNNAHPEPAPAGTATLNAQYQGQNPTGNWNLFVRDDANGDNGSIAGGWSLTITTVENAAATTTTVSGSPDPAFTNQNITFTANVTSTSTVNEGTVNFKRGGTGGPDLACTGGQPRPVSSGTATCTIAASSLGEGTHMITAVYNGTANFAPSNGSDTQEVNNPTVVNGNMFCNPGAITIPAVGSSAEPAVPYPSNIFVTGLNSMVITKVTVNLLDFTHTLPDDVDVLLVGPGGQNIVIMSDAGGPADVSVIDLTFDDAAAGTIPDEGPLGTGSFKPTDIDPGGNPDPFPAPAPAPSTNTTLAAAFNGTAPNGTWKLFVMDDGNGDGGSFAGGWCVNLTTVAVGPPPGTGDVKISEFRYNGPNGALDEYVELYNNTDAQITVADQFAGMGGTGWALVTSDNTSTAKAIIPAGTTIPARGHLLLTNSGGYSLGQYPSGNNGVSATLATGDVTYTTDIPINTGLALFRTTTSANFNAVERLDAVGPASVASILFKEGTGLPDIAAIASDYAWARRLPGGCTGTQPGFVNHNCTSAALIQSTGAPTSGIPQDTANNVTDFIFVDINGTATPVGNQRLGAPGPENRTSPIVRGNPNGSGGINPSVIDPQQASSAAPNRVRDLTPVTNGTFGTIDIRRKFTNNTGGPVTRLRFRVMDISTFPPLDDVGTTNDAADLRALTSMDTTVTVTGGMMVTVRGTTLEQDTSGNPGQPVGGAFNSSLSAGTVTLGTPLANGASISVRFVFGVTQNGKFRVFVTVEALP